MSRFTIAAQERIYMQRVRDLKNELGHKRVHAKPFEEVLNRGN